MSGVFDLIESSLGLSGLSFDNTIGRNLKTDLNRDVLALFRYNNIKCSWSVCTNFSLANPRNRSVRLN